VDDLDELLDVLPTRVSGPLRIDDRRSDLLEVVMDLGREPEARYPGREVILSSDVVTNADLDYVTERIGAARCAERDGEVEQYLSLPLTERKDQPAGVTAPAQSPTRRTSLPEQRPTESRSEPGYSNAAASPRDRGAVYAIDRWSHGERPRARPSPPTG